MANLNSNRSFAHASIRIARELKTELRREAKSRGLSFNALVNQILEKHVAFDRIVTQVGALPLNKDLFAGMLNQASLERWRELGKSSALNSLRKRSHF